MPRDAGKAVSTLVDDYSVLHQHKHGAWNVFLRQLRGDQRIDETRQLPGVDEPDEGRSRDLVRGWRRRRLGEGRRGYRKEKDS